MFRILHNNEFWLDVAYYFQFIEASWTSKYDEKHNEDILNFGWKRRLIDFLEARFLDWRNIKLHHRRYTKLVTGRLFI